MQTNTLSMRIYGGGLSTGFEPQPIISVGVAPDGFRPTPPAIVDEQQAWMITHAQAYTAYSLYSRKCQTSDGKPGQMIVCLFMPALQRLGNSVSPLNLLNTALDMFSIQVMTDERLPETQADNTVFASLLKRYKLEDRPTLLPQMQGSEPAAFCVENITQVDALMRHSRYPELANVGLLELGFHCTTTVNLPIKGKPQAQPAQNKESDQSTQNNHNIQKNQSNQSTQNSQSNQSTQNTQKTQSTPILDNEPEPTTETPPAKPKPKRSWIAIVLLVAVCCGITYWLSHNSTSENKVAAVEESTVIAEETSADETSAEESALRDAEMAEKEAAANAERKAKEALAEKKLAEAEARAKQSMDKAKPEKKKEEKAQQPATSGAKSAILKMINSGASIDRIRASKEWSQLSSKERFAVEGVTDLRWYKGGKQQIARTIIKKHMPFNSWAEIEKTRDEMKQAIANYQE